MIKQLIEELKPHKYAKIMPLLSGEDLAVLAEDIKKNGLKVPILLYEGKILDGRNRFNACIAAGYELEIDRDFLAYTENNKYCLMCGGKLLNGECGSCGLRHEQSGTINNFVDLVISLNLSRRHLSSDQKAAIGVEYLPLYEEEAKKRQGERTDLEGNIPQIIGEAIDQSSKHKTESAQQVAEKFGTNRQYVSDLKKIKIADPETFEDIKSGSKRLAEVKREQKKVDRKQRIIEKSSNNKSLGDRKYPVIYADPPWLYDYTKSESRAIENQYPTMSLDGLKGLPIQKISMNDCVLFLWATSPKVTEAIELIEAWGFNYRTCAVWDKQKIGMGYYFRQQHELLLVAAKGKLPVPEASDRFSSVISFPRGKHSKKPDIVYEMIEAMYPDYPKIELFARNTRENWAAWGNESAT